MVSVCQGSRHQGLNFMENTGYPLLLLVGSKFNVPMILIDIPRE